MSAFKGQMTKTIGHIELGAVLGQGGFGKVMHGYDTLKKIYVAVKYIDKKLIKDNNLQEYVEREIEVMKKLKHHHVVSLLSVINSNKGYYLVMELASHGELFDRIVESKRFDEDTARKYFQQMLSALRYCHRQGIVHRDLKAENLLLGENWDLKVCDFGLSRYVSAAQFDDKAAVFTSLAGSVDYQAPEVIKEEGYQGFSCDVWSCGVILFFMVCGYLPFAARTVEETQKRILANQYNKNNKYMSESVADLINHILVVDPAKRYTLDDIIHHPWFQVNLDRSLFPDVVAQVSPTSPSNPTSIPRMGESPSNTPAHPEQLEYREKLHLAFESLNVDRTGFLTPQQVKDMLVKIHHQPISDEAVSTFVSNFEHDEHGRITEEQFAVGWTRNQKNFDSKLDLLKLINLFHYDLETELLTLLRKAFDKMDLEHNGVLTENDITSLATSLDISEVEAQHLHKLIECGKGNVTFEVFVNFCTQGDMLKTNPIARRLNRVCEMFEVSDASGYKSFINTGFTVAGMRENIIHKLLERGKDIDTNFEKGELEGGLLYGTCTRDGRTLCKVGLQLHPAAAGYTKVLAYRIGGATTMFHEWFRTFRGILREEILRCNEDTEPVDEGELM